MSRSKLSAVDVSLAVPGLAITGKWEPDDAERLASWELLVELSTRVTTIDLPDDEGLARTALDSLYSLFGTTRSILKAHGPYLARSSGNGNLSFGVIAVRVLNDVLRPFLNEWNERLADYEKGRPIDKSPFAWEQEWTHNKEIRQALREIRPGLRQYVLVLAEAAQVPELAVAVLVPNGGQSRADNDAGWRDRGRALAPKLGFRPRHRMVRWLDPGVLARTGWRILRLRGRGPDARTSMKPPAEPTLDFADEPGDLWFDYVADLGDAFDPTMAVAWHLGRDVIAQDDFAVGDQIGDVPSAGLPRGRFLVMGGDEVYPYPSDRRYENQTTGPYSLALPASSLPSGTWVPVVAIPGNHDWYDGLDAFRKVFLGSKPFGGWQPVQKASWFSIRLPQGWWIWGLDTGLRGDVNESQQAYFAQQADLLQTGDRIMLVHPIPAWRLREKRVDESTDDELGRIHDLLAKVVPPGVTTPLFLAGDSHIYAHYVRTTATRAEDPVHHVTSGGGGAFLHPTHNLAPKVPQSTTEYEQYELQSHWPPRPISRHVLDGSTRRLILDRQNLPLASLLAVVHLAFAGLSGMGMRAWLHGHAGTAFGGSIRSIAGELARSPLTLVTLSIIVVVCAFVVPNPNVADPLVQRAARRFGFLHGLAQSAAFFVAAALGGVAVRILAASASPSVLDQLLGTAAGAVGGGLLSVVVLAHYLRLVNQGYRIHDNEAFSGRHIRGYKHFVRCHIDSAGNLRLHVVGLESVRTGWAAAMADGDPPPTTALALVDVIDLPAPVPGSPTKVAP